MIAASCGGVAVGLQNNFPCIYFILSSVPWFIKPRKVYRPLPANNAGHLCDFSLSKRARRTATDDSYSLCIPQSWHKHNHISIWRRSCCCLPWIINTLTVFVQLTCLLQISSLTIMSFKRTHHPFIIQLGENLFQFNLQMIKKSWSNLIFGPENANCFIQLLDLRVEMLVLLFGRS